MAPVKPSDANKSAPLQEELAENLERLSERELLAECEEDYGSVEKMVEKFEKILGKALDTGSSNRNSGSDVNDSSARKNVFSLSIDSKRAILERVKSAHTGNLTMAARNADGSDDDIDRQLEDLIDLKVIDQEGNIL